MSSEKPSSEKPSSKAIQTELLREIKTLSDRLDDKNRVIAELSKESGQVAHLRAEGDRLKRKYASDNLILTKAANELRDDLAAARWKAKKSFLINHKLVELIGLIYDRDAATILGSFRFGARGHEKKLTAKHDHCQFAYGNDEPCGSCHGCDKHKQA